MNFKTQVDYWDEARINKSSSALAKYLSLDVWLRLKMVKNYQKSVNIGVREVTLTENLVYEIAKFQELTGIKLFKLEEAVDEANNGADLVLNIEFGKLGFLTFPLQAKKLDTYSNLKNGSYPYYRHKNTQGYQSVLLTTYANSLGSKLPIYLLYNYTEGSQSLSVPLLEESLYGCSAVNANKIDESKFVYNKPRFSELHPVPGIPFYKLFEMFDNNVGGSSDNITDPKPISPREQVIAFYKNFGEDINDVTIKDLTFKKPEELSNNNWKPLNILGKSESKTTKGKSVFRLTLITNPISDIDEETLALDVGTIEIDKVEEDIYSTNTKKKIAEHII